MGRFLKAIYLVLLLGAVIVASAMLLPAYSNLRATRARVAGLHKTLDEKQSSCLGKNKLLDEIRTGDPRTIEKIAREKFKLCRPGEVIYVYDPERAKGSGAAGNGR
ncbi:MAG TPA: hypothetical protein DCZ94_20110 [Lentisphaeria bacterium]|nr:MAG: hypothetical protein A2X48_14755 [Lentisphaerae bacterium GWF2_49_21]HBC89251.1 hypothetical protein [Lentisphaeria bacterium]